MAETHEEIVKVWIAPGCIVCDSCETDCPEVFDVQEDTCLIRPDAQNSEFTKPLTPSIIVAAEGCPVDVIKFDTVEVEGAEPWAGKEEEAAPAAVGQGVALGPGPAQIIPEGPPDPKWAGLLADSRISHRGKSSDPIERAARVPAEVIAAALPTNAPPDARAAAMVGSGYFRPMPSVADRIRDKASALAAVAAMTRRQFNYTLAVAWGAMAFVGATTAAALQSFMVPKLTKEPPSTFRAGRLSDFPGPGIYTMHKGSNGVWINYLPNGKLVAISTTCTHLGCIPNWLAADDKFKCPCHGSGFNRLGINFEGPAPRPLERLNIYMDGEYIMVDKSKKYRYELGQWESADSYINV